MYVKSDPRSQLGGDKPATAAHPVAPAHYYDLADPATCDEGEGATHWYAAAQNFIAVFTQAEPGAVLSRDGQPDEYALILPDASATIEWGGKTTAASGHSVSFIPAGDSRITLPEGGTAIRLFTERAEDIVAAFNARFPDYTGDHNVPPLTPWPAPTGGAAVRTYSCDVEPEEGRFGRIYRSQNFMVNVIYPRQGPRDRSAMSPHSHAEFQQISLCLDGEYIHHLRWPWGTDANTWREDDHEHCGSPSIAVIPAGAIHTSEAVGEGRNFLIDIFCPPRRDFSERPGWVLNADDYPMPDAP